MPTASFGRVSVAWPSVAVRDVYILHPRGNCSTTIAVIAILGTHVSDPEAGLCAIFDGLF